MLDTHLVLWFAFELDRLSTKARKLIQGRDNELAFSVASLWEIAIKNSLGRADFKFDPLRLRNGLLAEGVAELRIEAAHVARVSSLPWVHKDPFDRLLVAQVQAERATLLTIDRTLAAYGRMALTLAIPRRQRA